MKKLSDQLKEFSEQLKTVMEKRNISQTELCEKTGIPKSAISQYLSGQFRPKQKRTYILAQALHTTPEFLMGLTDNPEIPTAPWTIIPGINDGFPIPTQIKDSLVSERIKEMNIESNISAIYQKNIRLLPVFESVSAGFGAYADDQVIDYCPFIISSEKEAAETIAIRVSGDSMSPKIEDGDIIRVHKQESVDSGSIAVVLLDGEEGLVKKVVYGDDWIELHSINPYYPVRRFEGEEVLRLRVVGLVKGSFRDI